MDPNFYELMSQSYPSIYFWPQPYAYMQWYQALSSEYHAYYINPDYYALNYEYSIKRYNEQMRLKKPSRSKKRAIKKKKMKQELEQERKAIGKWVQLERKDLIQGLQRIQLKQKRIKQKRMERYSHLIEIHKQVYKHYIKKGSSVPLKKRVSPKIRKKRLSYIKKMKYIFEEKVGRSSVENNSDDEWQSQEQEHVNGRERRRDGKRDPKINIRIEDLERIKYMQMGKLTGHVYQNIVLRQWVRNVPTEPLQGIALRLINRLAYKQAIRKVQKPTKPKKLIVSGIKQCKRTIQTIIDKNRSKMLVVALNVERNPLSKGVDDEVQNIIKSALQINLPIVHISTRSKLGRAFTGKFGPRITMISIINFEGYQDMMEELIKEWKSACDRYNLT